MQITIYASKESPENPFTVDTDDDERFLKNFASLDTSKYGMAVLFTFMDLRGTFGISYVGTVCGSDYNWVLVNFRNVNGEVRQRAATVITAMHEIAHIFGASHDDLSATCSPAGQANAARGGGNFVMYPTAAFGMNDNNRKFSPCSISFISKSLRDPNKTKCFSKV